MIKKAFPDSKRIKNTEDRHMCNMRPSQVIGVRSRSLTMAVRMDWHEGFQVYGEYGSVVGKTPNPWYLQSSQVECFSVRDGQYHRVLGADGHVYRLQIEGFADAILHGAPLHGASVEDGVQALRTLVAISRSVETGAWMSLADVTGGV